MSFYAVAFKNDGNSIKLLAGREVDGKININTDDLDKEDFSSNSDDHFKDEDREHIGDAKTFLNDFINRKPAVTEAPVPAEGVPVETVPVLPAPPESPMVEPSKKPGFLERLKTAGEEAAKDVKQVSSNLPEKSAPRPTTPTPSSSQKEILEKRKREFEQRILSIDPYVEKAKKSLDELRILEENAKAEMEKIKQKESEIRMELNVLSKHSTTMDNKGFINAINRILPKDDSQSQEAVASVTEMVKKATAQLLEITNLAIKIRDSKSELLPTIAKGAFDSLNSQNNNNINNLIGAVSRIDNFKGTASTRIEGLKTTIASMDYALKAIKEKKLKIEAIEKKKLEIETAKNLKQLEESKRNAAEREAAVAAAAARSPRRASRERQELPGVTTGSDGPRQVEVQGISPRPSTPQEEMGAKVSRLTGSTTRRGDKSTKESQDESFERRKKERRAARASGTGGRKTNKKSRKSYKQRAKKNKYTNRNRKGSRRLM